MNSPQIVYKLLKPTSDSTTIARFNNEVSCDIMDTLCRLCARQGLLLKSVFSRTNNVLLVDLIAIVCPIRIDINDEFPKNVCDECLEVIVSANKLRITSVKSDLKFRLGKFSTTFGTNIEEPPITIKKEYNGNMYDPLIVEVPMQCENQEQQILSYFSVQSFNEKKPEEKISSFFCEPCRKSFDSSFTYEKHIRVHDLFQHRPDEYSIYSNNEQTQGTTRDPRVTTLYRCDICPQAFLQKLPLEVHLLNSHTRNSKHIVNIPISENCYPLKCLKCSHTFFDHIKYCYHLRNVHQIEVRSVESSSTEMRDDLSIKSQSSTLNCTKCDYNTIHPSNFRSHMKTRHDLIISLKKPKASGVFQCQKCDYVTVIRCNFRRHMRIRHEIIVPRKIKSTTPANKKVHNLSEEVRHKSSLNVKPIQCDLCKKTFFNQTKFSEHCENIHKAKPHKNFSSRHRCITCNIGFLTKLDFEGTKNYFYINCHYKIRYLPCFLEHNQINHRYNFYDCYNYPCQQRFGSKLLFHQHLKEHKPFEPDDNNEYQCPVPNCDRSAKALSNIRRHVLHSHYTKKQIAERTAGTGLKS